MSAFKEQLAAIQARTQNLIPTSKWDDIKANAHDRAFTVAGAMQADLLADLAQSIEQAIAEGGSIESFRTDFDEAVKKHGWQHKGERNWRTRVIFNTNMRTSYAAGRLAQLNDPELQKVAPFWMYVHGGSADPRPDHLSWDGMVLPADDPFWEQHYPPNGWGCSCSVVAVSEASAKRLGGRFVDAPNDSQGIDEGWDYQPGKNVQAEIREIVTNKTTQLPAELGAAYFESMPEVQALNAVAFKAWFENVQSRKQPKGEKHLVGTLDAAVIAALKQQDLEPISAAVVIRDQDIAHIFRDRKRDKLSPAFFAALPEKLKSPQAIVLDTTGKQPVLHYVYPNGNNQHNKLVITLDYQFKSKDELGKRVVRTANMVNSGRVVATSNLKTKDMKVIQGEIK